MALREVLQFPDPRLKPMCEPITEVTDGLRIVFLEMLQCAMPTREQLLAGQFDVRA